MIQRIQTIYLAIAAVATIILLFIPIGYFATADYGFEYNAFVVKDRTPDGGIYMSTLYLGLTLIISAIFSIVAIFLYKNRSRQIKVVYANMFIFLFAILLMLYIYPSLVFVKQGLLGPDDPIQYNYWILACLIPAAAGLFLANNAIKKDEKLIRSADRLR